MYLILFAETDGFNCVCVFSLGVTVMFMETTLNVSIVNYEYEKIGLFIETNYPLWGFQVSNAYELSLH
jgi:hypothetical protein